MDKSLIAILSNIGLKQKEAFVYIACLELGSQNAAEIAKVAHLNRVTTYDILEKLIAKGFVNFLTKKNIKYFSALDPELVHAETQRHTDQLKMALPKLKHLKTGTKHPQVQYYEGIEGIKAIYDDTLTSKTEILNYANSREIRTFWPTYDEEYVAKRVKKKIRLRGIAPDDEYGKRVHAADKTTFREIRLVSPQKFDFTNEINIYDNKVAIVSLRDELIGMIIESDEIARTQRTIFQMAWEFAGKR
jgi:sugar-specific transcriptional regulator TrmB